MTPSTRRITGITRRLNPKVHLIVRTRYLQEIEPLYELGANEVIPEEFETSVEIFTRVLAIRRNSQILSNPRGDTRFLSNDTLAVLGLPDKIANLLGFIHG